MIIMQPFRLTNEKDSAVRVSTLELFFDLVFVFTITQVSDLILHAHNLQEIARAFLQGMTHALNGNSAQTPGKEDDIEG